MLFGGWPVETCLLIPHFVLNDFIRVLVIVDNVLSQSINVQSCAGVHLFGSHLNLAGF